MAERRIVCFGDSNTWGYDPAIGSNFRKSPFAEFFDADAVIEKSKELPKWYQLVADQFDCEFLDAASEVSGGEADSLHLSPEGHEKLAELVYRKLCPSSHGM